jgi:hypothetical protein
MVLVLRVRPSISAWALAGLVGLALGVIQGQ